MYQTRGAHIKMVALPVGTNIVLQSARQEGGVESGKKQERAGEKGGKRGRKGRGGKVEEKVRRK